MIAVVYYLFRPTAALKGVARQRADDYAEILAADTLWERHEQCRQPPQDGYDRLLHLKILFVAHLVAEYSHDPAFLSFWGGVFDVDVNTFDRYWTVETIENERVNSIEEDLRRAPNVLAQIQPTGNVEVDRRIRELCEAGTNPAKPEAADPNPGS